MEHELADDAAQNDWYHGDGIIMNHSADIPSSWILVEKDCTASTWIDDLIKQFERAKKWMKI